MGAIDLLSTFGANDTGQFLVFEQLFSLRKNLMNFCIYEVNKGAMFGTEYVVRFWVLIRVHEIVVSTFAPFRKMKSTLDPTFPHLHSKNLLKQIKGGPYF